METQSLFTHSFVSIQIKEEVKSKNQQVLYILQDDNRDSTSSSNIFKFELLKEALDELYQGESERKISTKKISNSFEVTLKCNKQIEYSSIVNMEDNDKMLILQDLIEQLEQIHQKGFLVNYFDFRFLFSTSKQFYSLQAMPCLTQMSQNHFLQTEDIAPSIKNACRSQLIFNGGSKASDYLALFKNFSLAAYPNSFQLKKPYKPGEELKQLMDENIAVSDEHIEFWYFTEECNDECVQIVGSDGKLSPRCTHTLEQSVVIPILQTKSTLLFKDICSKQLNREADIIKQQKKVNQQRKNAEQLKHNLQSLIDRIYQHTNKQQIEQDLQNVEMILIKLLELQGAENQTNYQKLIEYGNELIENIRNYQKAFVA